MSVLPPPRGVIIPTLSPSPHCDWCIHPPPSCCEFDRQSHRLLCARKYERRGGIIPTDAFPLVLLDKHEKDCPYNVHPTEMGHGKVRTEDVTCNVCYWEDIGTPTQWDPPSHGEVCDKYHSDTESVEGCADYEGDATNCDDVDDCETCNERNNTWCDAHYRMSRLEDGKEESD